MRTTVVTTTIPSRTYRRALGLSPSALVYLDSDNTLITPTETGIKVFGPKALARRLGVRVAGSYLDFDDKDGLMIIHVSDNHAEYEVAR